MTLTARPFAEVSFIVYGEPKPQGSKRAFVVNGKARMADMANTAGVQWRDAVSSGAAREREALGRPLDGTLCLSVTFRFAWPASRRRKSDQRASRAKATAPDLSKLVRSLEDGLQAAGLITDDARIAHIAASKLDIFNDWTGADIAVTEVEE